MAGVGISPEVPSRSLDVEDLQAAPRLLCVLPIVPLPATTGGALRTLNLVQSLETDFELVVLALRHPGQDVDAFRREVRAEVVVAELDRWLPRTAGHVASLAGSGPLNYSRYAGARLRQAFARLLQARHFDVIHFDHPHTAQLLPIAKALQPWAFTVLDAHNVEADVIARTALMRRWPTRVLGKLHGARVASLEKQVSQRVDAVLACSAVDADRFKEMGARRVEVIPNPAPPARAVATASGRDVIFVGSLDWWPNTDAALRLAKEIWPLCRGSLGGSRLALVGREPPKKLRALAAPDVLVTGSVASVEPWLKSAWATAIPLRAGSGTRIKILEAWSARVPVVATSLAVEGLPARHGENLFIAETPVEFAAALQRLYTDPALRERLADAGARTIAQFDRALLRRRIVELYREWTAAQAQTATRKPSSPWREEAQQRGPSILAAR